MVKEMLNSISIALMTATPGACELPHPVARSEATARAIASAVIAAAPEGPGVLAPYDLKLEYNEGREGWLAHESPVPRNGELIMGGGGWRMFIAACDGRVSDMRRQI